MKRINKREFDFNHSSPREYSLNKSTFGCAPCLEEAIKIKRQVGQRSINEIKIDEIKKIVRSIFKSSQNDN